MTSSAVVLRCLLWLKCWLAYHASNTEMPSTGEHLFSSSLDNNIENITEGKSTFLPQARKTKDSHCKAGPFFFAHMYLFWGQRSPPPPRTRPPNLLPSLPTNVLGSPRTPSRQKRPFLHEGAPTPQHLRGAGHLLFVFRSLACSLFGQLGFEGCFFRL